ncbi:MAG: pyridoxal phosphate-dependent aminotransferase [Clostridiales bacterium]|nr:pyridoxal phosphate-dependent aminotransferase [Clostridiales bacterium]MDY5513841.1 pyridoxal phosphate-dependent aminotransferase [Candidatus Ventricola sp.]
MISELYKGMLSGKSVIRELNEYANDVSRALGEENIFDYSLGNPSVPVPQAFNDKVIELLKTKSSIEVHGYSPSLGIPSVKEKLAASLNRRFDMHYTADDLFMTSGAAGALAHAFRLVTQPGDEILTFAPYFPEYNPYVNLTGAKLRVVPANTADFQINFDAFEAMLGEKVHAVLINTPNNPSGAVYSAETLTQLAALLTRKEQEYGHEIWLISDEPYREIVFDGKQAPYVSHFYPRTISCYSFSKSLSLPGERIGYVAVNPDSGVSKLLATMCGQISRGIGHNCPSSVIQLAVADTCDLTADLSVYETNMNILYGELTKLGFEIVRPGGTFYMFPKSPEPDATAFSRKAMKYGLVLVPSDSFGVPGYFRMAYCTDTQKVVRSLDAFGRLVREEYGGSL